MDKKLRSEKYDELQNFLKDNSEEIFQKQIAITTNSYKKIKF